MLLELLESSSSHVNNNNTIETFQIESKDASLLT